MKGDFSRVSFNPDDPTARVLRLQGGVDLDADWNEQVASLLHHHRGLAAELTGWHGTFDNGFRVERLADADTTGVRIDRGSYYVDGLRVYQAADTDFAVGPVLNPSPGTPPPGGCLLYLDVWERFVTGLEDDAIREVALAGRDTSARTRVVAAVRAVPLKTSDEYVTRDQFHDLIAGAGGRSPYWGPLPGLRAWVDDPPTDSAGAGKCLPLPGGGYGRPENQLYRVEIHARTTTPATATAAAQTVVRYKWSRDNGSVVYAVEALTATADTAGKTVVRATLADPRGSIGERLTDGTWVEFHSDPTADRDAPLPLLRVESVRGEEVTFVAVDGAFPADPEAARNHAFLRRWDMATPEVPAAPAGPDRVHLEDGVYVAFDDAARSLPGDYWLVPARVITRDVVWPRRPVDPNVRRTPQERATRVDATRAGHAYAPLARVTVANQAQAPALTIDESIGRRQFAALAPAGRDKPALEALLKSRLDARLNKAAVLAELKKKPSVVTALAPMLLYPTHLKVPPTGDLAADAKKTVLSLGEIAALSADAWLARLAAVRANPDQAYRDAAVALRVTAREVTQAFREWPAAELKQAEVNALFP